MAKGRSFWKANDDDNMKFNAIVGNPPYQVMDGGAQASATPIYNKFVDIAKAISPTYISMIMPARWYSGGKGLDDFRESMLCDKRISLLHDYLNGKVCFPNVEIKGGICYFLWDRTWNGECSIFTHTETENIHSVRFLKEKGETIFIRDSRMVNIKQKVASLHFRTFSSLVSSMKPYGLRGDFFKNPEKYGLPKIKETKQNGDVTIFGLDEKQHRVKRYIPKDYPLPKTNGIIDYKIFIPRNFGSGRIEDNIFTTIIGHPYEICTETFVQIYPFNSYEETLNCDKYLKTKFVRFMIGIRKQDQGASRDVYSFVPIQDFSDNSDIDWSKSISEIDQQLYAKYYLTDKEISFIERTMKLI